MSTHDVIKFSTCTGNFGFKVPYLLEIGYPYESNYTAIYYTIGDLTFYTNAILDFSYNLADETVINPYKLYNLGSGFKSRVSITKEILRLIVVEGKAKRTYKVGTLSRDFGFEFEVTAISSSRCSLTVSVSDGSKFYVTVNFYSLFDVMKLQESNPRKQLYLKLLSDNFPDKESLIQCAELLYSLNSSNSDGVSNVNK